MTQTTTELVAKIEAELRRLDAADSPSNSSGICVYADDNLPDGWVRVSDGTGRVYGAADEILAALAAVDYDPDATVEQESEPFVAGQDPTTGELYGDVDVETVQRDNGWELAWEALGEFSNQKPEPAVCCYCDGANPDAPNGEPYQCVHCGETFTASAE